MAERKKPALACGLQSEKWALAGLLFWVINLMRQVNMQEYSNPRAHIKRAS